MADSIVGDVSRLQANRDKLLMLVATMAKLLVGMGTFVVMARFLGPAPFGLLATAIAYGTLLGVVTDYGLVTYALKSASERLENASEIVGGALLLKALLSVISMVAATGACLVLLPFGEAMIYVMVIFGVMMAALADLVFVATRARRLFKIEATVSIGISLMWIVAVGVTAALTKSVLYTAIAFSVSRTIYFFIVVFALRAYLSRSAGQLRSVAATLRSSWWYAIENIIMTLSSQTDVLLFGLFLAKYDLGIYQAGARLIQVISPFAVVLSTIYVPQLTRLAAGSDAPAFRGAVRKMLLEFNLLALIGGTAFAVAGPYATHLIYGPKYGPLTALWPGFGLAVTLRFAAAGFRVPLVALGKTRSRITSQLVAIGCITVCGTLAMPRFGLGVTSLVLAVSFIPSYAMLIIDVSRTKDWDKSSAVIGIATLVCGLAVYFATTFISNL